MNYQHPAPKVRCERTRTGILIGGAYIPRPKPEHAHGITGPHTKRRDWHELGHAILPWLGVGIICLLCAGVVAGVL